MREVWKNTLLPLLMTLGLMLTVEIFSSTVLPWLGLFEYRIPLNILIILFMGFRFETPYIGIFIFIIQYFHGFFSVEGWEMGVIAGVLISLLISYLKELLQFNSALTTSLIVQIFQFIWLIITSSLIYLKNGNMDYLWAKFWRFLPESIFISLMAPIAFAFLGWIWKKNQGGHLRESSHVW